MTASEEAARQETNIEENQPHAKRHDHRLWIPLTVIDKIGDSL